MVQLLQPLSRLDIGQPAQTEAQSTKEGSQEAYISSDSEAGICLKDFSGSVFFLCNICINESPPGLELKVQNLGNIALVGFCVGLLVHFAQGFVVPRLHLLTVQAISNRTVRERRFNVNTFTPASEKINHSSWHVYD